MKYVLKEMTKMEKPREKLLYLGAHSLADYELLAVLLRTGTKEKSVINVAIDVMNEISDLSILNEVTIEELTKVKGIGKTKALEIMAAIELGKRLFQNQKKIEIIRSVKDCYYYLQDMQNYMQEHFVCIYLTANNRIINKKVISVGSLTQTCADPREVIKWGMKYSAYAFIIAHNHPSGSATPSENDHKITEQIILVAKTMGILFVDHVIIAKNSYYSFREKRIFTI